MRRILPTKSNQTQEFKASEEKWQAARRGYTTPVLFLRALLDGGRADSPKLCAREEARCGARCGVM